MRITVEALRNFAREVYKDLPQYGTFDDWVLVRITGSWRSKGGARFARGDVALASPEVNHHNPEMGPTRRVFSTVTGSMCAVDVALMRDI